MKEQPSLAQLRWWASDEFRAIGSASAKRNLRAFAEAPRCAATRKRDGEPCQNPGLGTGGRCRLHGGATPSGAGKWHLPRWPDRTSKNLEEKLHRKLARLAVLAERREQRLAAMSPEQRERYDAWRAAHNPLAPRGRRKADRLAGSPNARATMSPEDAAVLARLDARIAELKAEIAAAERDDVPTETEQDVFA